MLACNFPVTYTCSFLKDNSAVTKPAWFNFDAVNRQISVETGDKTAIGVYQITVSAEIAQVLQPTSVLKTNFTFQMTVTSDCVKTSIDDKTISNMTTKVSQA